MRSRSNIQSRYSIRRSITSSSSSWHLYKQQRYAVVISLFSFSSFYRLWSIRISPSVAVMMGASPCGRVRNRNDVADNYDGDDGSVSPSPICTHTRREVTMHFHCGASTAHEGNRSQIAHSSGQSLLYDVKYVASFHEDNSAALDFFQSFAFRSFSISSSLFTNENESLLSPTTSSRRQPSRLDLLRQMQI